MEFVKVLACSFSYESWVDLSNHGVTCRNVQYYSRDKKGQRVKVLAGACGDGCHGMNRLYAPVCSPNIFFGAVMKNAAV